MTQVLNKKGSIDARDLVFQKICVTLAYKSNRRPHPQDHYDLYWIDGRLCRPPPSRVMVVDDVLTTGAHFKAKQRLLSERFGDTRIVGAFVARRVP